MSCGQTNECLSIVAEMRLEILSHPQAPQQPPRTHQQQRFAILTDGTSWRVEILDFERSTNSQVSRVEYGCDGENVYGVTTYDTNYAGPRLVARNGMIVTNAGGRPPRNNGSAKVLPGRIPMPESLLGYIWLAYLSGCELKQLEANSVFELPALYSGGMETHHLTFREPARWVLSGGFPFTPSRSEFFGGEIYGYSKEFGLTRHATSQPVTNLALVVESTTNSGAWTMPARFSLALFGPPFGTNGPWLAARGIGETISIARVPRPHSFLPAVPSSTSVIDWRFDPEPKTYYASNRWLSLEEAKRAGRR